MPSGQLAAVFAPYHQPDSPGAALAVLHHGAVVQEYCFGLANLEHLVPITPDTRFHIVSITKTFTAAAILLLQAQGHLCLDDDIRRFLPEIPASCCAQGSITVRHLLTMTSGLRDGLELLRLCGIWYPAPQREQDILDLAYTVADTSFTAGTRFVYTNTNFVLLAEIIHRLTGQDADTFRRTTLYEPLGLSATGQRAADDVVLADLATGYIPAPGGGFRRGVHLLGISGDVVTTTLRDMVTWLHVLRHGVIDGVLLTAQMATPMRTADNTVLYYGLGLAVRTYRGLRVLNHSGSQPGYKAHIAYIPERDFGVVLLSNRDDINPSQRLVEIAEGFLAGQFPHLHSATLALMHGLGLSPAQRAAVNGTYIDAHSGEMMTLRCQGYALQGEVLGVPLSLYPAAPGVFRDGDDYRATQPARLALSFGPTSEAVTCHLSLGGFTGQFAKQPMITTSSDTLAAYIGRYENITIGSVHEVWCSANGDLRIRYGATPSRDLTFPMQPVAPDRFCVYPTAAGIAYQHMFHFQREPTGQVVAAEVTMERLKRFRLLRCRVEMSVS